MTSISTRHIRHDWPEWIDWNNQKSVKTMCGVRSRPGLCGIPGVTEQDSVVEKNGRKVWGWCMSCVRGTFPYYRPPELSLSCAPQEILDLHDRARLALTPQYAAMLNEQLERAKKRNAPASIAVIENMLRQLTAPS